MGDRTEERVDQARKRQTGETKQLVTPHLETCRALVRRTLYPRAETHHNKCKNPSLPSLSVCRCAVPALRSSLHPSQLLSLWLLSGEMTFALQVTPHLRSQAENSSFKRKYFRYHSCPAESHIPLSAYTATYIYIYISPQCLS